MSPAHPSQGTPDPEPEETDRAAGAGERSVTIHGDNSGPVTTGDHSPINQFTVGPLRPVEEVSPAARPVGISGPVPLFVGREPELASLEQALAAGPGVVVQAVHGLGGVGKSALAAHYVTLHANRYTQVVWITAQNATEVNKGLHRFALALEPHLGFLSLEALVERATAWLAAHEGWLLVLDNVTSPQDVGALLGRLGGRSGRFLVTSRSSVGWNRFGATAVPLDVLTPVQALALLAKIVRTTPGALEGGAELCAELGFLPLALIQAGGYIEQNQPDHRLACRRYLQLLAEHPAHMYATGDENTDPQHVIARTWNITLDRLNDNPLAGQILRILAWYAPDQIPTSLLGPLATQLDLEEAIGKLAAYNMLIRTSDDPADLQVGQHLKVHRLVQAVARTPDLTDPQSAQVLIDDARDRAANLLNSAAPDDPSLWRPWRQFITHVHALAKHTDPATDTVETASLLQRATFYLSEESTAAEKAVGNAMYVYIGRAVSAYQRLRGPHDKKTLVARRWRAWFFEELDVVENVSAELERTLGADDPEFLMSLHDRAWRHLHREEFEASEELFRRALASQQHLPTEKINDFFATQYGLGYCLVKQKRFPEATDILADCTQQRTLSLPPLHPHTLITKRLLAVTLVYQLQFDKAQGILQETLAEQQSLFREGHTEIDETQAWATLATAQLEVGSYRRLAAASPDDHEADLASALSKLGLLQLQVQWREDAAAAAEESVEIYRRLTAVDPDAHEADFAAALSTLVTVWWALGKRGEVLPPAEEAAKVYRRLAEADPDVHEGDLAAALHVWALVRFRARREFLEALQTTGEAVEICRKRVTASPERILVLLHALLDLQADLLLELGFLQQARTVRAWLEANDTDRRNE